MIGSFSAGAHEAPHPKAVALRLTRDRIAISIELTIPAGEASRGLRQAFDRDKSGRLDAEEQRALVEHLVKTAALRTRLAVDGRDVPLRLAAAPSVDHGEDPAASTALLTLRADLDAPWPAGSGDWLGRRQLVLTDDAPSATGHVPASVSCTGCTISSFSAGAFLRDDRGVDHVLAAHVSKAEPLQLAVRIGGSGFSCGSH